MTAAAPRYPYPQALRRMWRRPAIQAMNNRRRRMYDDLRDLLECARYRARFRREGADGPNDEQLERYARYRARFRSGYDRDYYTSRDLAECWSYDMRIIRPGDMGAAILYAFGIDSFDDVQRILSIPPSEPRYLPAGTDARSQAALLGSHMRRRPRLAVDMGCGRGEIASTLAHLGVDAIAVDPSAHAKSLVGDTARLFYGHPAPPPFLNKTCYEALRGMSAPPDTVIFCESIEHIPAEEVWRSFRLLSDMASSAPHGIRVVITNWIDLHPIRRIGRDWDHLHDVDDGFYDKLEAYASRTVFRRGSHLVLELGPGSTHHEPGRSAT